MFSDGIDRARQATLRAYFARLERGEWDGLVALCTEDVLYQMPGEDPQVVLTIEGREAFRAFSSLTFASFAEPRFATTDMRVVGNGILVDYDSSWLSTAGERKNLPGAILFCFRGEKISEIAVRLDLRAMRHAV